MRRKTLTREQYKEKYDRLMEECNYICQDNEKIVQCHAPYPSYWFVSNKGYLISVHKKNIKILKPNPRETGRKNKDGSRNGRDWYYEYHVHGEKNNRHVTMHKLIAEHFLKCEINYDNEETEVHHIRKKKSFKPEEAVACNCVDNLQVLPKSVHDIATDYGKYTQEELDAKMKKKIQDSGCPNYYVTQEELENFFINAINRALQSNEQPLMFTMNSTDAVEKIEVEVHPITEKITR